MIIRSNGPDANRASLPNVDIFAVTDGIDDRGWVSGRGTEPPAIVLMINLAHDESDDDYLHDLAEVVEAVKAGRTVGASQIIPTN